MVGALFDTNILIDYLAGRDAAREELGRFSRKAISIITWAEVMVGASADVEAPTRAFLQQFEILDVGQDISERAVILRRTHRMNLPDALIWATAQARALLLVTRDRADFSSEDPGVRVPY